MQLFVPASVLLLLAPFAASTALGSPPPVAARSLKKMDGKCTSKGGCKVPGGLHSAYPCWSSKCEEADKGKACVIAPGIDGSWVAKCPTNMLPYEWEWPWVDHSKDKKNNGSKENGKKDGKDD